VSDDPATDVGAARRATLRRRRLALAAHTGAGVDSHRGLLDPDPRVQVAALGALERLGLLTSDDVIGALGCPDSSVRRRAIDAAPSVRGRGSRSSLPAAVTAALADTDPLVVVGAAWYLGERRRRAAVPQLVTTARQHGDPRCREAAVAALGAIGDPAGLDAVFAALDDKPAVRRRATVALAGFEDPRIESVLRDVAARDRDWQVRQAAAELLDSPDPTTGPDVAVTRPR
jgi:HEAT repeat protein